jgi:NADH:ubiquinone oxidoreductase subunit K
MTDLFLPNWLISFTHVCVMAVFIIGILCFFVRKEFIRQIFGLKLMLQSVSLGLIISGWQRSDLNTPQAMIISALIIEAIVIGLALTMIIHIAKHPEDDRRILAHLKQKRKGHNHDG